MIDFLRAAAVTGIPIFVLTIGTEYVWRRKKYHSEFTRKFIHIIAGTYAAFWPWFIGWHNIQLLALGALCALIISRQLNIFKSMHLARWHGAGEFLSTVSIGVLPFVTHNKWIFAAAVLNLSLADGFAAVAGTKFGKDNSYLVFGQRKSAVGTLTFWMISVAVLTMYIVATHVGWGWLTILWLPAVAATFENIGVHGLDNLLVPFVIAVVLAAG